MAWIKLNTLPILYYYDVNDLFLNLFYFRLLVLTHDAMGVNGFFLSLLSTLIELHVRKLTEEKIYDLKYVGQYVGSKGILNSLIQI
jgi:hypothetical protein